MNEMLYVGLLKIKAGSKYLYTDYIMLLIVELASSSSMIALQVGCFGLGGT